MSSKKDNRVDKQLNDKIVDKPIEIDYCCLELKQKEDNLKDGRAVAQRKVADNNIKRVSKWRDNNPDGTMPECAKKLNLSYSTVYRIVKGLNSKSDEIELER